MNTQNNQDPDPYFKAIVRGVIMGFVAMVIFLVALTTCGCSLLHPGIEEPDVRKWIRGHLWEGYRNRRNAQLMHAIDCPHPSHTLIIHDTIFVHDTINYITTIPSKP